MSGKVISDDCIESVAKEQRVKLYIVTGIPEDTIFITRTRKEISVCGGGEGGGGGRGKTEEYPRILFLKPRTRK
jgi:mRNA-decapping enzyme subunit 2